MKTCDDIFSCNFVTLIHIVFCEIEKELADPHIGPIDTPVTLVQAGKPKVTHRKFRITPAMSPVTSCIVYYIRKNKEVVSEMIDFQVEEVFENEVWTVSSAN